MREIKFRAWDGEKMFVPGGLKNPVNFTDNVVHMQYTGLKDVNGKEIYEGDIVKNKYNKLELVKWGYFVESVNFNEYSNQNYGWYVGQDSQYEDFEQIHNGMWEVIGNIYENPELIKKENDN